MGVNRREKERLMSAAVLDWANILVRWFHVIAGIWWIGSSLYFVTLDNSFKPPKEPRDGVDGETFMVHGGYYYLVEKRFMQAGKMPDRLLWFKWEATFTWISGMLLLAVVYYFTGGSYLIDSKVADISLQTAVMASMGLVLGCWLLYDFVWQTLGKKSEKLGTAVSLLGLVGLAFGLTNLFSGRAAFIHFGAILGTLMVANVWIRILPGQRKMLQDALDGKTPDYSQGKFAKVRSVHNSYMTFPVIFMMISNHFPITFGNQYNWAVMLLLFVVGGGIRHFQISEERGNPAYWVLAPALLALVGTMGVTYPKAKTGAGGIDAADLVPFTKVQGIIYQRCTPCHSSVPYPPPGAKYTEPPNGIVMETPEQIKGLASKIAAQAVHSNAMPLGNMTRITKKERETLGKWVEQIESGI